MSRNYQHQTRQKPTILGPNPYLLPTHRRHEKQRLTTRRPMLVMKKNMDMKMIEKLHDCFILDFNPYEQKSYSFKKYDGVYITAEKGQVALKDYPHPRHLCTRYPFHKTTPSKFCSRCYCYVCDVAAPCKDWSNHCDATDLYLHWRISRKLHRIIEECFNNLLLALLNSKG